MAFQNRFVTRYLNPLEVDAQIEQIVANHPTLCQLSELSFFSHGYQGTRIEARGRFKLKTLRITANNSVTAKPAVLLMRSHHAREWINAMAVVETAWQLVENYRPDDNDPRVQLITKILGLVASF